MPTDFEELKRQLLQTDEQFRQLATQHLRRHRTSSAAHAART